MAPQLSQGSPLLSYVGGGRRLQAVDHTLICTERKLSSQDLLGLCFETILMSVESRSLAVRLVPRNRCEELGTCRKIRIRGIDSERK